MLFNAACAILCGILIGIIIGLIVVSSMIRQRMLEVENYWKQKIVNANNTWRDFHRAELDKWSEKTTVLINKTYHDAIEERDKAWEKKFGGVKPKPKPPN